MDSPLSSFSSQSAFNQLKVAVIGGGIGGLSAAIALRRAGHIGSSSSPPTTADVSDHITHVVEIFERRSFDVEVGASISCAANGMSHPHHRCSTLSIIYLVLSRYSMAPRVGSRHSNDETRRPSEARHARLGDWPRTQPIQPGQL